MDHSSSIPRKARFPLYARILFWFFLNLLLIALGLYLFAAGPLRLGLDSFLAGRAGERIQATANLIFAGLMGTPRDQWNEILQGYREAHDDQVEFLLVSPDGSIQAGPSHPLPEEVVTRLREMSGPMRFRSRPFGRGRERGGERFWGGRSSPDSNIQGSNETPALQGSESPPVAPPPPPPSPSGRRMGPGSFPKFLVRTDSPRTYWIGVRLPNLERGGPAPLPLVLLLASPSISAGGLWIDPTPWVVVAAAIILGSALFWFPLVHGITRSIKRMTLATEMIAAGRLETRLQETRSDELGRLGQAINGMTERLSEFVSGQKRFLGDTAHELCSPLARIQMALGILEQRADPPAQAYVNDVREEVEHMSGLVNELLSFSKASLRPADVKLQAVDLSKLVQQTLRREGKEGVDIQVAVPEHLQVLAEPDLLARSLSNLLRNAVRYAGSAGPIVLTAEALRDQVRLTVADQGPGIPEHSLSRIFDPFYRPQEARERETGGVGLGLAIVKTCLEACRGEVSARNRTPSGLEVIVLLRRV